MLFQGAGKPWNNIIRVAVKGVVAIGNRVIITVFYADKSAFFQHLDRNHRGAVFILPRFFSLEILAFDLIRVFFDGMDNVIVLVTGAVIQGAEQLALFEITFNAVLLFQCIGVEGLVPWPGSAEQTGRPVQQGQGIIIGCQ